MISNPTSVLSEKVAPQMSVIWLSSPFPSFFKGIRFGVLRHRVIAEPLGLIYLPINEGAGLIGQQSSKRLKFFPSIHLFLLSQS